MFTPRANHAMLTLHHNLPASIATNPDVKCVLFSANDTPEVLKENVFTTVGLHPALKPAVRISSTNPLVPLGSIEGLPDLTDTDSVLKSLDILLMEAGKNKWQHFDADCNIVVDCSGDGTVELLRSLRGTHEVNQTHRLVADQTALEISFKPPELPPSVFIVNHGVSGQVFNSSRTRPSATCRPAAPTPSMCPSAAAAAAAAAAEVAVEAAAVEAAAAAEGGGGGGGGDGGGAPAHPHPHPVPAPKAKQVSHHWLIPFKDAALVLACRCCACWPARRPSPPHSARQAARRGRRRRLRRVLDSRNVSGRHPSTTAPSRCYPASTSASPRAAHSAAQQCGPASL